MQIFAHGTHIRLIRGMQPPPLTGAHFMLQMEIDPSCILQRQICLVAAIACHAVRFDCI